MKTKLLKKLRREFAQQHHVTLYRGCYHMFYHGLGEAKAVTKEEMRLLIRDAYFDFLTRHLQSKGRYKHVYTYLWN